MSQVVRVSGPGPVCGESVDDQISMTLFTSTSGRRLTELYVFDYTSGATTDRSVKESSCHKDGEASGFRV